MPIAQSLAAHRALVRLAPGALLLLAVTGTSPSLAGEPWKRATSALDLTRTVAVVVGLAQDGGVWTSIRCGGLVHQDRGIALPLGDEHHLGWSPVTGSSTRPGEELRFITGSVDPPIPHGIHG